MRFSAATAILSAAFLFQLGMGAATSLDESHLEKRRNYRHCACQAASNGIIDSLSTALVAQYNAWRWHTENFAQISGTDGARYTGIYIVANSGTINGDAFHNECMLNGGADSTCF
ncbi:hypothetical protein BKA63DRAFT_573237 [Paraphoma chrysanthemicola]|nr:hypothetical protein BKA63DRAFT_573237 [Paraphoma chrysanthemicola]